MSVLLCTVIGVFTILLIYSLKKDPKPILGVYTQNGKWYYLKYVIFAIMYYARKYGNRKSDSAFERILANPAEMDRAQSFSEHANAFDAVFFISAAKGQDDKGVYVIAGCERRPMGLCHGPFYIGLPNKGLLCSKKIPDTLLFGAQIGEFGAEGLKIEVVEPMKKWTVKYKGQMWYQNEPSKLLDVNFKGEWTATSKHFVFDTDLYPPAVIRSIAREPWSKSYFEKLKKSHQCHYEQFGVMECKFDIDGESYEFKLPSFRDHSFGEQRDWTLMYRYAFHHMFLEDGTSASVGVISQPSTASHMEAGVVCGRDGRTWPVRSVSLRLPEHGEGGEPPRDYGFTFTAGGDTYVVQVQVEYQSVHFVSPDWDARMVERFCKYSVNGVQGRGVSEFHYRHHDGRPESVATGDPEWYRRMCHKV